MNRIHAFVAAPLLLGLSCTASPADPQAPPAVSEAVESLMPGVAPAWLKPSPMAGLWEVALGPHIFYISSDGEHLLRGDIVSVGSRENLTRPARNKARLNAVESLGEDSMIVFTPASAKYTVSVFTDVDCGYCAKLHREMQTYLDAGIRIRYLAYPRAGVGSKSYDKIVSVWCADDQRQAMTDAKAGRDLAPQSCKNPVDDHFEMGQLVGVRGTPTIVLQTGDIVPGYVPADRLLRTLREVGAVPRS
jgi:thiol:disulfide interchange protein DsbC